MRETVRRIVAWPTAWALFWAGHCVSAVFLRHDATAFMYPIYNRLMGWSVVVQDWAGLSSPWRKQLEATDGGR